MTGTKVQGFHKHLLSDAWVPAQLWVVAQAGSAAGVYTIENTNSRTFMDLTGGTLCASLTRVRMLNMISTPGNVASDTPIIGSKSTGHPEQHWAIQAASRVEDAYV